MNAANTRRKIPTPAMTTNLQIGDAFPDFELSDDRKELRRLSKFTRPSLSSERLGFAGGYPFIVVFGRGFFCLRDHSSRSTGASELEQPNGEVAKWPKLAAR